MVYKTLVLASSLVCTYALASNERGNGGKLVECDENHPKRYELLDLYEARKIPEWGLVTDLGGAELSADEKVNAVLDKLARVDPNKARVLKTKFSEFYSNTSFLWNMRLADIPDVGLASLENGCQLVQLAVQKKPQLPGQKLYTIDKDYWDKIGSDNQAALILHELVYGLTDGKHKDSSGVRYFTANITSTRMNDITVPAFETIAETSRLELPSIKLGRYLLRYATLEQLETGSFKGTLLKAVEEETPVGNMTRKTFASPKAKVVVNETGTLQEGEVKFAYFVPTCFDQTPEGGFPIVSFWSGTKSRTSAWVTFYESGLPKNVSAKLKKKETLQFVQIGDLRDGSCKNSSNFNAMLSHDQTGEKAQLNVEFFEFGSFKKIDAPFVINNIMTLSRDDVRFSTPLGALCPSASSCPHFTFSGNIELFDNGAIQSGYLTTNTLLIDRNGGHTFLAGSQAIFDREGYVVNRP